MLHQLALIVHVLGVVLWIGGTTSAAWTAAQLATTSGAGRSIALGAVRKSLLTFASPGLLLAWIGGLAMLIDGWSAMYSHAGWMHGKLTVAVIASGLTGVITGRVRRAASGEGALSSGALGGLVIALTLLAVIAICLVVLRPGA